MQLTYISRFQFKVVDGDVYSLPAYGDGFWQKYLDVFSTIHVIGEPVKPYLDDGRMVKISDSRIKVDIVQPFERPGELRNYFFAKKKLIQFIHSSSAVLIKPASNRGYFCIKECKRNNIPYMIETTGDVQSALLVRKNPIMKIYSYFLFYRTTRSIKDCKYGLYVTEEFLQNKYPIFGEMCGCTDAIIPEPPSDMLKIRIAKIEEHSDSVFNVGLIGYYHDNNKGIDTAIKAVNMCQKSFPDMTMNLRILGVGTEEDRLKWEKYSQKNGGDACLIFDKPVSGPLEVAKWIDKMDLIILPSRSEGFPRAIAEAMSRACPTITSDVCGLSEMVEKRWQHTPEDYKRLASLMCLMLSKNDNMVSAAKYNFEKSKRYKFEALKLKRNKFLFSFKQYASRIRGSNE